MQPIDNPQLSSTTRQIHPQFPLTHRRRWPLYAHLARSSVVETIFTRSAPAVGDPYQYSRKMLTGSHPTDLKARNGLARENYPSCQWNSLCVIFHSPFHLSRVNTSEARVLAPANLP